MLLGSGKKKLQEAARHWLNATRPRGQDELHDDLRAFGIDPEEADDAEDGRLPVLERNWPTVMAFMSMQTQWRISMNGITGLDYTAIEAAFRLQRRRLRAGVFEGLQVMEGAVLSELAEQRAQS